MQQRLRGLIYRDQPRKPSCAVATTIFDLTAKGRTEEAEALDEWGRWPADKRDEFGKRPLSPREVSAWLKKVGYEVGEAALRWHREVLTKVNPRRNGCKCTVEDLDYWLGEFEYEANPDNFADAGPDSCFDEHFERQRDEHARAASNDDQSEDHFDKPWPESLDEYLGGSWSAHTDEQSEDHFDKPWPESLDEYLGGSRSAHTEEQAKERSVNPWAEYKIDLGRGEIDLDDIRDFIYTQRAEDARSTSNDDFGGIAA